MSLHKLSWLSTTPNFKYTSYFTTSLFTILHSSSYTMYSYEPLPRYEKMPAAESLEIDNGSAESTTETAIESQTDSIRVAADTTDQPRWAFKYLPLFYWVAPLAAHICMVFFNNDHSKFLCRNHTSAYMAANIIPVVVTTIVMWVLGGPWSGLKPSWMRKSEWDHVVTMLGMFFGLTFGSAWSHHLGEFCEAVL